jgi:hypothetical protein
MGSIKREAAYPESWWKSRTAEQLQEFVRAGFISGKLFDGAQRELERRARESSRRAAEAAEEKVQHRVDKGNRVALAAAAFSVVSAICAMIWLLFVR